jgi:hypothetical protein
MVILFFGWAYCPYTAWTQQEASQAVEVLESGLQHLDFALESDALAYQEWLSGDHAPTYDLNKVSREQLQAMHLFDPLRIEQLLAYRELLGPFLYVQELQAVPGWELDDIRMLLRFVHLGGDLNARSVPVWKGLYAGNNQLLLRYGRAFPDNLPGTAEGLPNAWGLRFRHRADHRVSWGVTAENDPGEAFFRGSNAGGFDFYSGHVFVRDISRRIQGIALGDFTARFGQGLLLQSGFAPGKSAESISVMRGGPTLAPYASFGEAYFLRGGAVACKPGKHWEAVLLLGTRRRDATVSGSLDSTEQGSFSAFRFSGLHRTPSERAQERNIRETVLGLSAKRVFAAGHIGLQSLSIRYDQPLVPPPQPHRLYALKGRQLDAASVDYRWAHRGYVFFGETAVSIRGGWSTINGVLFTPERRITLALLQRHFSARYASVYAHPFAETSGAQNERGFYLGADIRPVKKWQINLYSDVWKHPWLRSGAQGSSTGADHLLRVWWKPARHVSVYALWQHAAKESDSPNDWSGGLHAVSRQRLRLHASYRMPGGIELRSRLENIRASSSALGRSSGILLFQEAVIKPLGSRVYGTIRYLVFDTDTYDARVYAFENDLFAALSIPAFSGQGTRYFINLHARMAPGLRLEARFEQTLQQRTVTSSGRTGRQSAFKIQLNHQFDTGHGKD